MDATVTPSRSEGAAAQSTPFTGEYAILPYTQFGLVRTFGEAEPQAPVP